MRARRPPAPRPLQQVYTPCRQRFARRAMPPAAGRWRRYPILSTPPRPPSCSVPAQACVLQRAPLDAVQREKGSVVRRGVVPARAACRHATQAAGVGGVWERHARMKTEQARISVFSQ